MTLDVLVMGSALLAGIFASGHCLAMCGGIAIASASQCAGARPLRANLELHFGRTLGYASAGLLVGSVAKSAHWLNTGKALVPYLRASVGLILIVVALRILGLQRSLRAISWIERKTLGPLQPLLRRLSAKLFPAQAVWQRLVLGALWGWLPCGLSLTMLMAALLLADPIDAAMLMLCFGLGTMPAMVSFGYTGSLSLSNRFRARWRPLAAALIGLAGLITMAMPWLMQRPELHAWLHAVGCIS
jgi:hypothetical protein